MPAPPLPEPDLIFFDPALQSTVEGLTLSAVRAYVEQAVAAERERFTPLRAKGVVDADDNLDCWDMDPYEICARHVAALNAKDPAAMWRVVDLFGREATDPPAQLHVATALGANAALERRQSYDDALVAAERERCARAVEQYGGAWDVTTQNFARVIRAGST